MDSNGRVTCKPNMCASSTPIRSASLATAVLTERAPNGNEDSNGNEPSGNGTTSEKFVTFRNHFATKIHKPPKNLQPHKHP